MQDVSKSLNLSPDQTNRLNQATTGLQTRYNKDYSGLNSLDPAQRATRSQELLNNYNKDWTTATNTIFNDQQRTRYGQLDLQYRGIGAFQDSNLQRRLNFTDDQRRQFDDHNTWHQKQWQGINDMGRTNPDQGLRLYNDYRKESTDRFNRFLTPEQQRTWRDMTGEAYQFRPQFNPNPGK